MKFTFYSSFSNFAVLNPTADAAANLQLQQAVQKLICNFEAATTVLSPWNELSVASQLSPSVQTRTNCYLFVASLERIVNRTGKGLWDAQSCYHPAPYRSHHGDMAMQISFGGKTEVPNVQNSCCRQWCGTVLFEVKIFATLTLPMCYQCNNGRVGSLWLNRSFLPYPVFNSSFLFCEEICPAYFHSW